MILNSREFRHLVNPTIADRNLLPIPYRPIFYDLAYNYLEFPIDNIKRLAAGKPRIPQGQEIPEEEKQQEKKGWFSFLQ